RLGAVFAADTFDHRRSHGLRYITNPPGNAARVHQHLRIGDGDVDFDELFGTLRQTGYLDRDDALIVSNVVAEDERAEEASRFQLERIRELIGGPAPSPRTQRRTNRPRRQCPPRVSGRASWRARNVASLCTAAPRAAGE